MSGKGEGGRRQPVSASNQQGSHGKPSILSRAGLREKHVHKTEDKGRDNTVTGQVGAVRLNLEVYLPIMTISTGTERESKPADCWASAYRLLKDGSFLKSTPLSCPFQTKAPSNTTRYKKLAIIYWENVYLSPLAAEIAAQLRRKAG